MKKSIGVIGVIFFCLFLIAVTTEVKASNDIREKAKTGFANVANGWTEVIVEPARGVTSDRNVVEKVFGFIPDIVKGITKVAIRTGSGIIDLVLLPFPGNNVVGTCPIADDHL